MPRTAIYPQYTPETRQGRSIQPAEIIYGVDDHGNEQVLMQDLISGGWKNLYTLTRITDDEVQRRFPQFFTVELSPVTMGEPLPVAAAA